MRRIALALALAACASPAFAVQDRYGPPRTEPPGAALMAPLPAGAMLNWNGKAAAPQDAHEAAAPQRPTPIAPIAPWAQRTAPPPAPAHTVAIPQPPARRLPPPAEGRLYAPRLAAAQPPVPTALAPNATQRPRVYSVGRQYGAQPDPIPGAAAPAGPALTLKEIPTSENLGRTQAPLDDGRASQAVAVPVTKDNAASNRVNRFVP